MTTYTFTMPVGSNPDDILFAAIPGTIPKPDNVTVSYVSYSTPTLLLTYNTITLTPTQITNMTALVASNPHPANTPWALDAADLSRLAGIATILRNQAAAASGVTVTTANNNAVTQQIVNDLVIFCARLADLIEYLGVG